jgi:hypothetical protein
MFIGRENEYEKEELELQRMIFDITIINTASMSMRNPRKIISKHSYAIWYEPSYVDDEFILGFYGYKLLV